MTSNTVSIEQTDRETFQAAQVLPVAAAHFIHDVYSAFIAPLLPIIIEKLSLTLTMAGSLNAILQIPSVLSPFIGYLADKVNLRYFVILAPAVTATFMSFIGLANSYVMLAILVFIAGISVAAFHAPAPAMIGRVAGKKVGLGMSLFMAAGELARSVGPLLAVWAVTTWGFEGMYRVVIFGWAASLILYWRLRGAPTHTQKPNNFRSVVPFLGSVFIPLIFIHIFTRLMTECLATYLPTYMSAQGANLFLAGGALAILEGAGVLGALSSGTLSDRLGRKSMLVFLTAASALLMLIFLNVHGMLQLFVLAALGFTSLSSAPVMLAYVQEQMPDYRAVGNGIFMLISFLSRPFAILVVGILGDEFGLETTFLWGAFLSLLAIPAILKLRAHSGINFTDSG